MKLILVCLALSLLSPLAALAGGLDGFLADVNVQARADLPGFSVRLSSQFGVPVTQVQAVVGSVREPADAFMIFQLSRMSGKQPGRVMAVYSLSRKNGWGNIAKEVGIKPGSADFHALKNGNLRFGGQSARYGSTRGDGKVRGHGRGHKRQKVVEERTPPGVTAAAALSTIDSLIGVAPRATCRIVQSGPSCTPPAVKSLS